MKRDIAPIRPAAVSKELLCRRTCGRERISLSSLIPLWEERRRRKAIASMAVVGVGILLLAICLQGVFFCVTGEWPLLTWGRMWWQGGLSSPPPDVIPGGTNEKEEGKSEEEASGSEETGEEDTPSVGTDGSEEGSELDTERKTDVPTEDASGESDQDREEESMTQAPSEPTVPEGGIPLASEDMSHGDMGGDYVICAPNTPNLTPQEGNLFSRSEMPAVLILHTHPYEGYWDGSPWYDPSTGGLAQTETPGDGDGVVALGAALTRYLRSLGVTVIHLRVAVDVGETADAVYTRTEKAVAYYCSLYPDIGLILDLRRSAELTESGGILRTVGRYRGEACGQVGISVYGNRLTAERDLAIGIAVRNRLWGTDTSISRPVKIKGGNGLLGESGKVPFLTLDLGAAGNTYAEAERLIPPLGDAIAYVLMNC